MALVALGAFETLAVATAMPLVAAALDGRGAYALAFGVPTATGIVGMVLGGLWSDARGPRACVRAGVALFVAGLLLAGLAPSMAVLVGGRGIQGLGTGLLGVALYVVVGQCYPDDLRARMFAAFAAAWVLPSLVGPLVSGVIAERLSWRWVFLAVAVVALPAAIPVLRCLQARSAIRTAVNLQRLVWAALAGLGVGLLQLAGQLPAVVGGVLGLAAAVMVVASGPRLLPSGTFRARPGLPTVVLLRGLAAGGFVGAQTFLPLLLVEQRALSPTMAGLVLTVGSVAWAAASAVRGRLPARLEHRLLRLGMILLAGGIVSAAALVASHGPNSGFLLSWTAASAGMGTLVPTLSVMAIRQVPVDEQGAVGSALQISDALFAAVGLAAAGTVFGWLLERDPLAPHLTGLAMVALLPILGSLLTGRAGGAVAGGSARLGRVVVLGGSVAGLLAARVLADHAEEILVVDRDDLNRDGPRRGVPQGRHVHGLLGGGVQILDQLFPGFVSQAVAAGAVGGDVGEVRWCLFGYRLRSAYADLPGLAASRPFLEARIRDRLAYCPGVQILGGRTVTGLAVEQGRVRGAYLLGGNRDEELLTADLVVDATGRGSHLPTWLEQAGFPAPTVDRVEVGVRYASRVVRLRRGALGTGHGLIVAATPQNPRGVIIAAQEGDRHIVTLAGVHGVKPPTEWASVKAFAASLLIPDVANALDCAVPLEDPSEIRFPASTRHRYERLRRFPAGLLVIGDAVCSFNPVYGQGMASAARQAMVLQRMLNAGDLRPQRYFGRLADAVNAPWTMAIAGDLGFPGFAGPRPLLARLVAIVQPALAAAAASDQRVSRALLRVLGLVDPAWTLLRPSVLLGVLRSSRIPRPGPGLSGSMAADELESSEVGA